MSRDVLAARLRILAAAFLFSTGGAAIKSCSFSAWQIAGLRSGIAAIALAAMLPRGRRGFAPRVWLVGAVYAATLALYVAANKLTTAANTIFLQSTAPLYVVALGPLLLREPLRRRDLPFAAALALGLSLFFVGREVPQATAPDPTSGNLLGAGAGITWALTLVGLRWIARGPNDASAATVVAGNLLALVACAPALVSVGGSAFDWTIVTYLGVFQIGLAYVFLTRGVGRLPALEVSLLLLLEPVLNAAWAWAIHGERPAPLALTGCAVILLATTAFVVGARRAA